MPANWHLMFCYDIVMKLKAKDSGLYLHVYNRIGLSLVHLDR